MKIKLIPSIIAVAICALIAYGFYSFCRGENQILLAIGACVFSLLTLGTTMAVCFQNSRTSVNVKVVSGIFFAIAMVSNLIFMFVNFSVPAYVITNGILLLVWLLIAYVIVRASK